MKQNHTNYYENGRRIAVDHKTPIDVLEPESEPAHDIGSDLLTVIEAIAATYLRGDPEVTRIAWRFLLNKEPKSIRYCASCIGRSAAAISKRVGILSEQFGLPLSNEKIRQLRRDVAKRSWNKRKRREQAPDVFPEKHSRTGEAVNV